MQYFNYNQGKGGQCDDFRLWTPPVVEIEVFTDKRIRLREQTNRGMHPTKWLCLLDE